MFVNSPAASWQGNSQRQSARPSTTLLRPAGSATSGSATSAAPVKVLQIAGVAPSQETARSGQYPLMRPLNLLTGPLSQPLADDFIAFVLSPEGQQIVEEAGWIPVR